MRNTLFLFLFLVVGCAEEAPVNFPVLEGAEQQIAMTKWQRSCALCHVDGNGGAPRVGDKEAWAPRIVQSEETLLTHTLEGLGRMPPLGYCMDCTETEFLYLTGFMAGALSERALSEGALSEGALSEEKALSQKEALSQKKPSAKEKAHD